MSSLGKKLEELRKNAGITQEELAQELKVSRQTVSLWEQDLVAPKSDALKSLCEFFNVKPEYLLFENAEIKPLFDIPDTQPSENKNNELRQEIAVTDEACKKPKKLSGKKKVLIACAVVISLLVAGFMLFVAWLKAPTEGATVSVSSSSWNFDIVTILQILAGVLIFVVVCVITVLLVKYIKNRKK